MNDTTVERNSVGGSDKHQRVLSDLILGLAEGMRVENGSLQSPHLAELVTGIVTIALPYNNAAIDALANGKDGLTDGKVLLLNEEALVHRIQGFCDEGAGWEEKAHRWFRQCLGDVAAAARGEPLQHLQSVSIERMVRVLNGVVQRPDWESALGYDTARLDQKPVLNALALIENDQRTVPNNDLGVGGFNANAANVIKALFSPHDPSLLGSVEKRTEVNQDFHSTIQGEALHSLSLSMMTLIGIGEQAFGLLSKPGQGSLEEAIDFGSEVVEAHQRGGIVRDMVKLAFSGMPTHGPHLSGFSPSGEFNRPQTRNDIPGM